MQGDPKIQLLDQVHGHLNSVAADPSTRLDTSLLDRCQAILSTELPHEYLVRLQGDAIATFRSLEEDPKPLTSLVVKAASFITFADVQGFLKFDDLIAGLQAPIPAISFLALIYLHKAAESPADAATVGSTTGLIEAFLKLWLTTPETYISEKALEVLQALLETDLPYKTTYINKPQEHLVGNASGQGLVWRRLFHDKDVYEIFFASSSLKHPSDLSKVQISNAQGRLLDFVSKVAAINWDAIGTSQLPEVEQKYNSTSLLDFTANKMIDDDDILLLVTKFDFFQKLVKLKDIPKEGCANLSAVPTDSSPALEFLTATGNHQRIFQYYLDDTVDSISVSLMANTHHKYIATYLRTYPAHFLHDSRLVQSIIKTLNRNLDIRPTVWAHGTPPYADLWILQSLPASVLVDAGRIGQNPLHHIPTSPANAGALHTLALMFHGPAKPSEVITFPPQSNASNASNASEAETSNDLEASIASKQLFADYVNSHADFWSNVGSVTNVLAMEDSALAAVNLLNAIATASWPSETATPQIQISGSSFQTGVAVLITIGLSAYQALLLPPQPIAGAAGSDSSSAAWKISREKFDVLQTIQRLLKDGIGKDEVPADHFSAIAISLDSRIALGPWGRSAGAGSRIQTLEL